MSFKIKRIALNTATATHDSASVVRDLAGHCGFEGERKAMKISTFACFPLPPLMNISNLDLNLHTFYELWRLKLVSTVCFQIFVPH